MYATLTEQLAKEKLREACSEARRARLVRAVRAERRAQRAARNAKVAVERAVIALATGH
jgi:hypothetical protein